jgi:ABC-type enterochelin transport system ATPase subunit
MVIKNCTDQSVYIAGALCQGTSDIVRPEIVDTLPDEMGIVSRKVVWELPEQQPNTILIVDRDCRLANAHRADLVSLEAGQLIKNAGEDAKRGRRLSLDKPKRREKHEAITNTPQ